MHVHGCDDTVAADAQQRAAEHQIVGPNLPSQVGAADCQPDLPLGTSATWYNETFIKGRVRREREKSEGGNGHLDRVDDGIAERVESHSLACGSTIRIWTKTGRFRMRPH